MILSPYFFWRLLCSPNLQGIDQDGKLQHGVCRHGRILVSHFLLRTSAHVRSTLSYVRLRFIQIDKGSRDHRGLHWAVSPFLSCLFLSPGLLARTSLNRVPGQGSPVRRSIIGLADDGSSVLESCAVFLRGDEPRCIIVQAPLEGTTLRVLFDGQSLPCSTQRFGRAGNDRHTLLTIRAPTHEESDNSSSSDSAPLVGLAWVVSVQKESSGKSVRPTRSSRHFVLSRSMQAPRSSTKRKSSKLEREYHSFSCPPRTLRRR